MSARLTWCYRRILSKLYFARSTHKCGVLKGGVGNHNGGLLRKVASYRVIFSSASKAGTGVKEMLIPDGSVTRSGDAVGSAPGGGV